MLLLVGPHLDKRLFLPEYLDTSLTHILFNFLLQTFNLTHKNWLTPNMAQTHLPRFVVHSCNFDMQHEGSCRELWLLFCFQSVFVWWKIALPIHHFTVATNFSPPRNGNNWTPLIELLSKFLNGEGEVNPREKITASKLAQDPNVLSTLAIMLAERFSLDKANNHTFQKQVQLLSKTIL